MNFKVGDRVKLVGNVDKGYDYLIGMEGVIVGKPLIKCDRDWRVHSDRIYNTPDGATGEYWAFYAYQLAPLTPPASDAWADAKVREVTKPTYLEPERVKEKTV